jgi:C_GCAxxG_C_C family probable redox protein
MSGKNWEEIAEKAETLATEYEKTCTGCAQSVVAGLLDALEIESPDVFKAASGLADGIGLTGDGSCGALTGSAMVIGLVLGRERKDHRDMLKPMQSYLLCKELHDEFVREYGSCRCHDIQRRITGRTYDLLDPKQLEEAMKEGMLEHCAGVCGRAARRTVELLAREASATAPDPEL